MLLRGPCPRQNVIGQWHRWFAWYPVNTVCGTILWLETVEYRRSFKVWNLDIWGQWITEYRRLGSKAECSTIRLARQQPHTYGS
jgi:hypothetical protein